MHSAGRMGRYVLAGTVGAGLGAGVALRTTEAVHKMTARITREMMANMFERMPDDFPPKRMLRQLEEIREQNSRILQLLEGGSVTKSSGDDA